MKISGIPTLISALATLALVLVSIPAKAGFIEVGASGTYRKSNFDSSSYDEAQALTASFSYLFNEMSALEWSYTDGFSKRFVSSDGVPGVPDQITTVHTELMAVDFVLTLGEKDDIVRPYVKAGIGYLLKKRLVENFTGNSSSYSSAPPIDEPRGWVPSAGVGAKISITEELSLKLGFDAWSSNPLGHGDATQFDVVGRLGLSWMF